VDGAGVPSSFIASMRKGRHNRQVSAEQLIALEATVAEIARLYTVATGYAALRARAEAELLPRLNALAGRLRTLVRTAQLTEDAIDGVATEILVLGSEWHV